MRQFANQWHLKTIGAVWLYIWSWKQAVAFFWDDAVEDIPLIPVEP
jgi:hypothetical protein